MSIASVDGIDAMVAPAVLITLGSLLANGILAASTAVLGNLRSLAGERDELLPHDYHPAVVVQFGLRADQDLRLRSTSTSTGVSLARSVSLAKSDLSCSISSDTPTRGGWRSVSWLCAS